jgi:hypothetical protein
MSDSNVAQLTEAAPPAKVSDIAGSIVLSTALALLLVRLSAFRQLLSHAATVSIELDEGNPTIQRFKDLLTAGERKQVKQAIDELSEAYIERADDYVDVLRKMGLTIGGPEDGASASYPFATEMILAAVRVHTEELTRELIVTHFEPFAENEIQLQYALFLMRSLDSANATEMLGSALLPALIAHFEEFLAALLRAGLARYPKALGELSDVPYEIVEKYSANAETEDLQRWAIDKKVSSMIADSPTEWQIRIKRWTGIDLADLGADWAMIHEAIQRRHVVVHNAGRVDFDYLGRVDPAFLSGVYVGKLLRCDRQYMDSVIDELEQFARLLAISWGPRLLKTSPLSVVPDLVEAVMDLERRRQWARGEQLCLLALENGEKDGAHGGIIRINLWYCQQEMGGSAGSLTHEIRDWSPTDDRERLGKAILLRDKKEILDLLRDELETGPNRMLARLMLRGLPMIQRAMSDFPEIRSLLDHASARRSSKKRRRKRNRG